MTDTEVAMYEFIFPIASLIPIGLIGLLSVNLFGQRTKNRQDRLEERDRVDIARIPWSRSGSFQTERASADNSIILSQEAS